jgi:hypothetical protein
MGEMSTGRGNEPLNRIVWELVHMGNVEILPAFDICI